MKAIRGIGLDIRLRVIDKKDGVVFDKTEKAHSFVNNFMQMMKHSLDGVANTDYVDTGGAARAASYSRSYYYSAWMTWVAGMNTMGAAGDVARGVCVGTSNTAFALAQYNLQAPIAHGSGSGQLYYGAQVAIADPTWASPNVTLIISRDFSNQYSSGITVREIGIRGNPGVATQQMAQTLFARDVVADTVVAAGQILNVQYILKTVV